MDKIRSKIFMLFKIALVDNEFLEEEWEFLVKFSKSKGIGVTELKNTLSSPTGKIIFPSNEKEKLDLLSELSKMIWIDGKVKKEEIELFIQFYDLLGFPEEHKKITLDVILNKNQSLCKDTLVDILLF